MTDGRQGFSLIELMVVVGLIGVLTAIAVPQYGRFQSKARQIEAKLALSAIYKVETLGRIEHGGYSVCLTKLGYEPELADPGIARGYYARGFQAATAAADPLTCDAPERQNWDASKRVSAAAPASGSSLTHDACCASGFVAEAAGNVSSSTVAYDYWTMDAGQTLTNTTPQL